MARERSSLYLALLIGHPPFCFRFIMTSIGSTCLYRARARRTPPHCAENLPGGPCTLACSRPASDRRAGAQFGIGMAGRHSHYHALGRSFDRPTAGKISRSQLVPDPPVRPPPGADSVVAQRLTRPSPGPPAGAFAASAGRASGYCPKRNSVPSRHIACSTIASLRATATTAFLWPRRRWIARSQALSDDQLFVLTSRPLAAS